jgi:hypothetical protein
MKLTPYSNPFHNQAKRKLAGALSIVDSIDGAVDGDRLLGDAFTKLARLNRTASARRYRAAAQVAQ